MGNPNSHFWAGFSGRLWVESLGRAMSGLWNGDLAQAAVWNLGQLYKPRFGRRLNETVKPLYSVSLSTVFSPQLAIF